MTALPPANVMKEISETTKQVEASPTKKSWMKSRKFIGGVAALFVVMVVVGAYLLYWSNHETTDDAYTTGNVHSISSRVTGTVVEVSVDDNQFVKKGQVLVRLDARDFQVQVDKAQAEYNRAKANFERAQSLRGSLSGDIAISKQEYDTMEASLGIAKATLDDALNQLNYCTITAPTDGFIGDKSVQTGNRLAVGTVLMSVVEDLWVVANYKETQVGRMSKGQRVSVSLDGVRGHTFEGMIDSFSPGSGSVFALLPPENATGNFTKIVQRVPVKIRLNPGSMKGYESRLVPGLSVEADVTLTPTESTGLARN